MVTLGGFLRLLLESGEGFDDGLGLGWVGFGVGKGTGGLTSVFGGTWG